MTWRQILVVALGCLLVSLVVFHVVLPPGSILMTTDDNIGHNTTAKNILPMGFRAWWDAQALWGTSGISVFRPMYVLLYLLPVEVYQNWAHGLALAAASFWLVVYLRRRGCSWAACVLGGLTAFWTGNNLTLTYAGHTNKFATMAFAAAAIALLDRAATDRRWGWGALAGMAVGFMFFEQADVALFSAVFIAAFGLYRAVQAADGWKPWPMVRLLLPAAVIGGVMVLGAVGPYQKVATEGITVMQQDPQVQYDFLTQWSWPPEESLDFIAPGFTGWRSGEESGPYWGRMGRSAGWETTRQGFMNFKLENHYMGALPVLLALFAFGGAGAHWLRKKRDARTADTLFWGLVCAGALVLAFGKFTPIYRLVAMLPGFSGMRNPNKFLHIFQMALGIVAAFGWDGLLNGRLGVRPGRWMFTVAGGLLALSGLGVWVDHAASVQKLIQFGWPAKLAETIQSNMTFALFYGAGMCAVGYVACLGLERGWLRKSLPWIVPALVLVDAVFLLAPHYLQRMPRSFIEKNILSDFLKGDLSDNRMTFQPQDGIYNHWLTYLFPYQSIATINVTQMSRMPEDYSRFFQQAGRDPVRMWELAAVSHVVGPAGLLGEFERNPAWHGKFEKALDFNVYNDGLGGFSIRPAAADRPGQHAILRFKDRPPRASLIHQWAVLEDEAALQRLFASDFQPGRMAVLSPQAKDLWPDMPESADLTAGTVKIVNSRPGRFELEVESSGPALVRVSEHFDSGWKAWVNGKAAPVLRTDYLFLGVPVNAGHQTIRLEYLPAAWPFWLQMVWVPGLLAALISLGLQRKGGA